MPTNLLNYIFLGDACRHVTLALRVLNFMEIGLKFRNPALARCVLGFAGAHVPVITISIDQGRFASPSPSQSKSKSGTMRINKISTSLYRILV